MRKVDEWFDCYKSNFEKDYLALATEHGAVQCIAYLLEWKKNA